MADTKHPAEVLADELARMRAQLDPVDDWRGPLDLAGAALRRIPALEAERDRLLVEVEAMRKDGERYRWLRDRRWNTSAMCVVMAPKDAVKPGRYCPGGECLDAEIDAAIAATETKETK